MSVIEQKKKIVNKGRRSLCGWVEIWDEGKQKFYYHDPQTNKTSWKHPKLMGILPKEDDGYVSSPTVNTPTEKDEEFEVKKEVVTKKIEKGKNIVKFGFISKMGEVIKNWKVRYFVLFDDGELEYYASVTKPKNEDEYADVTKAEYKGGINVNLCRFRNPKGVKKGDLVLEINLANRNMFIAFETKEELVSWKKAIESQGCEFYDILVPVQKSIVEIKEQKRKMSQSTIKRDFKGRAVELALEDQKESLQRVKSSKSFLQQKVLAPTNTSFYGTPENEEI